MIKLRTGSPGTLIAVTHGQMNAQGNQTSRRCMMNKHSVLLSIGAALFFSLFFFGAGHAFQTDRNQNAGILMADEMYGTASLPFKHVSNTPIPCGGRTGAACWKHSPLGSGAMATDGSRYTYHVSNTPNTCGGRTGAACRNDSPAGSGEMATDGSRYTITTSASAAGMLVGVGLITLVGLGAKRLRHPHGHHDGHHA